MAGLKKSPKRKDITNPNTVLVLFLVFFVLLSIGLGTWGYFAYAGQDKLRDDAVKKAKEAEGAQLAADFSEFLALDALQAMGNTLDAGNELKRWESSREQYFQEAGRFKDEKVRRQALVNMLADIRKDLGYDEANKKYAANYRGEFNSLKDKLKTAQANVVAAEDKYAKKEQDYKLIKKRIDGDWDKFVAQIKEGNKLSLAAAQAKTATMEEYFKRNQELQNLLDKAENDHKAAIDKHVALNSVLEANLKKAVDRAANANASVVRITSEPHALVLDISQGKPLWDNPLGKITKVNIKEREVHLNIGANMGVKAGLTLNVFGASWKGRAEGLFKGTLEVLQVLGPTSSRARVTSLHDAEGKEIALNDQSRGRIQREADNPLKEGDLVFNLVFGTHAVIAGNINWGGSTSDSPAEQMRHLREFMSILDRQGVKIDAYLDLADGKLQGAVTAKTRFFIGDGRSAQGKGTFTKGEDGKGEDAKKLNDAIAAVRAQAIERGMLIISADNLANIIGYRRTRSASEFEPSGFRPAVPFAGVER